MDDSGTKHPHRVISLARHSHDWFALGGILIHDEDIPYAEDRIDEFRSRWPEMGDSPLHSTEIRGSHDNFTWLIKGSSIQQAFIKDLESLLLGLPVIGLACVIDRPGYNHRYADQYGLSRWNLCKTAFAVSVERAAKYAHDQNRKLRVYVERSSKTEEAILKGYYNELKLNGHWFDQSTSSKYSPFNAEDYAKILYEFKPKFKSSRLMQIADLFLWPMCMGGYQSPNIAYQHLKDAGKLINSIIPEKDIATRGIKYSCFELQMSPSENEKAE